MKNCIDLQKELGFDNTSYLMTGPKDIILREIREFRTTYDKCDILLNYLITVETYLQKIEPLYDITRECEKKLEKEL